MERQVEGYGIIQKSIAPLWEIPGTFYAKAEGYHTALGDEVLMGMGVGITGRRRDGFVPVITHYGYPGFIRAEDLLEVPLAALKGWEQSRLMVLDHCCADVVSVPKVQGVILCTLWKGALVSVAEPDEGQSGWARVVLPDGRAGYLRKRFLAEKKYAQNFLWENHLPQTQGRREEMQEELLRQAVSYLGAPYRWGGKTPQGIDCSGLVSMCYMAAGMLIYRDARIKAGYPVKAIAREQMQSGDLLYFPGHIAMYMGADRYIHATGHMDSGKVVINSLNPQHQDYREDLDKSMYAVGSIW